MSTLRYIIIFLAGVYSTVAVSGPEKIPATSVASLSVYNTYAIVKLVDLNSNSQGCSGAFRFGFVAIDWSTDTNNKNYLNQAIIAQMDGGEIGFGVNGCHPWGGGIPLVYRVDYTAAQ